MVSEVFMARRPKALGPPGLRSRVVRGPKDGRWYWRTERADKSVADTRWATAAEMRTVNRQLAEQGAASIPDADTASIDMLDRLLGAYIAYLDDMGQHAAGSLTAYRLQRTQIKESGGGGYDVERLDSGALEQLRANLARRPLAPRSVRGCLHLVSAAWKWGRREGLTPDREVAMPEVKIPKTPQYTPNQAQIAEVVEVLDGWPRLAVRLIWATGARIGEIASLEWSAVDLDDGTVTLDGKTGPRIVPLHEALVADIRAWPRSVDQVLGVAFNTVRVNLPRRIGEACTATKQRHWTPQALRRAAVDELQRAGVDVKTAADLLGHSPQVMLEYYRQVTDDDRRVAMKRARLGLPPQPKLVALDGGKVRE